MGFDKCAELNSNAKLKTNLPSGKELQGLICNWQILEVNLNIRRHFFS